MKQIHIVAYQLIGYLLSHGSRLADWVDAHSPAVDKYGTCIGGMIGLRLMRWHANLWAICVKEGTVK